MLWIINENKNLRWYWSDYFYNMDELRLLKINKICSNIQNHG